MKHEDIIVETGGKTIQKRTLSQVKKIIKDKGRFEGVMVGNKVKPSHFHEGWSLACDFKSDNIDEFTKLKNSFEYYLDPELGRYTHFYENIKKSE